MPNFFRVFAIASGPLGACFSFRTCVTENEDFGSAVGAAKVVAAKARMVRLEKSMLTKRQLEVVIVKNVFVFDAEVEFDEGKRQTLYRRLATLREVSFR